MTLKILCLVTLVLVGSAKQLLDQAMLDDDVVDPANYFPKTHKDQWVHHLKVRQLEQTPTQIPKEQSPQLLVPNPDTKSEQKTNQTDQSPKPETQSQPLTPPTEADKVDQKTSQNSQPQPQPSTQTKDFGDVSKQFMAMLNPGEQQGLDNSLIKRLIAKLGLTDAQDLKDQYQATKVEEEAKKQEQLQLDQNLSEWVRKEKTDSTVFKTKIQQQNQIFDRFQFRLNVSQTKKLYMDVPKGRPQNYMFDITMFWLVGGRYVPANNPLESTFLEINVIYHNASILKKKVYVQSTFEWNQYLENGEIQLTFTNSIPYPLLVLVDLERLRTIPNSPKQQQLDPLATRLKAIVDSIQQRHTQNLFKTKSQLGFKQNQESHITQLLSMAGLQTLTIVAIAIVQLYFLQILVSNNNIMV